MLKITSLVQPVTLDGFTHMQALPLLSQIMLCRVMETLVHKASDEAIVFTFLDTPTPTSASQSLLQ